jgi:hypothetical protein
MENIINTIIRRKIKQAMTMIRLGMDMTIDEIISMVFDELSKQRVVIDNSHREYIRQEVTKRLQHKIR